jgi:hypothetical protein
MADGERPEECENFEDSTKRRLKVPKSQVGEKLVAEKATRPTGENQWARSYSITGRPAPAFAFRVPT